MTTTTSTRVLLASAVNLWYYNASFGGGNSQLASKQEFYYDPTTAVFLLRSKDELLYSSWREYRYPCPVGQSKVLLRRLLQVQSESPVRLSFQGWLCRLDLEESRQGPELRMQFYVKGRAQEVRLSPRLTARLLMAAKGPKWLSFVDKLAA